MNILQINTVDVIGGAARATNRLHRGLISIGYDSSMFVAQRHGSDKSVKVFTPPSDFTSRVLRRLYRGRIAGDFASYRKSRPNNYEIFSDDRSEYGATLMRQLPSSDVINLHWIVGFVDLRHFFNALPQRTPIVWTLHDMNPFTGGCHYDHGCSKFMDRCGSCPQLGSNDPEDLSRQIWLRKQKTFDQIGNGRLHIVTPSKWLAKEVKRSKLFGRFPTSVIPNSVDTEAFSPRDRHVAREALDLPLNAKIALFAADSATNRRKGFPLLAEALKGLPSMDSLNLISIGSGNPLIEAEIPHFHLGHLENARLLSLVYSSADLFVIPSFQDNLPNTVLESFACGTPVVGFDVGGIPDMVRPGITGMLAQAHDTNALRGAILQLLQDHKGLNEMSIKCRALAVQEYSLEVQARRYAELYHRLLSKSKKVLK